MVLSIFQRFLDWLRALFFKEEMELTLVGLQYSGKTTFVNVLGKKNQISVSQLVDQNYISPFSRNVFLKIFEDLFMMT